MASRAYSNAQEAAPNDEHLIIHGSSQQDAANLKHDASSSHRELAAGLSVQVRCMRTHLYTENSICPAIAAQLCLVVGERLHGSYEAAYHVQIQPSLRAPQQYLHYIAHLWPLRALWQRLPGRGWR